MSNKQGADVAKFGKVFTMGGGQSHEQQDDSILSTDDAKTPRLYESATLEVGQWPIVYSNNYNIGFMGLQRLHPFDSGKWGKVFNFLQGINTVYSLCYSIIYCI